MLDRLVSSSYLKTLEKSIASSSLRHKVISNNVANVNTPGFKRSDVSFQDVLSQVLDKHKLPMAITNQRHMGQMGVSQTNPFVYTDNTTTMRNDGNNVDIDVEMANLAQNQLYYNAVAQRVSGYFTTLKSVINGGR